MAYRKTAVTPLLTHWSYCSLALSHRDVLLLLQLCHWFVAIYDIHSKMISNSNLAKSHFHITHFTVQYIPRNMHTVFALLCFVVVIHWLIFPYPSGLLHWHCGNLTIAPVPAKHPWWIWINSSCEFIMNDCITTTKQSTTKPCAYFLGYTVCCCGPVARWYCFINDTKIKGYYIRLRGITLTS